MVWGLMPELFTTEVLADWLHRITPEDEDEVEPLMHCAHGRHARTSRHARTNAVLGAARSARGRAVLVAAAVTGLLSLAAVGGPASAMAAETVLPPAAQAPAQADSAAAQARGAALASLVLSDSKHPAPSAPRTPAVAGLLAPVPAVTTPAAKSVLKAAAAAKRAVTTPAAARSEVRAPVAKPAPKAVPKPKANGWVAPVPGASISERYGLPNSGYAAGYHTGTDFAVNVGTPVAAVGPGTVVSAGWQNSYGNTVVIRLSGGRYVLYGHLSAFKVSAGEHVSGGERVALSGDTGNSTGPHLHFEMRTSNVYGADIDPLAFLRSHQVTNY